MPQPHGNIKEPGSPFEEALYLADHDCSWVQATSCALRQGREYAFTWSNAHEMQTKR